MKTISAPLIVLYALLEGVFLGAFSQVMEQRWPGIVMTAVVATLCTFAGMFAGYRRHRQGDQPQPPDLRDGHDRLPAVQRGQRRGLMFGWTSGWGFNSSGLLGIGISLLGVGLAAYALAIDFDDIGNAVRAGMPEKVSWKLAFGLIVTLVWLYLEILRLLAGCATDRFAVTDGRVTSSVSSSAWSSGGSSCRSTRRFRVCRWSAPVIRLADAGRRGG